MVSEVAVQRFVESCFEKFLKIRKNTCAGACNFMKTEVPIQFSSSEFRDILPNSFFPEHGQNTAFVALTIHFDSTL